MFEYNFEFEAVLKLNVKSCQFSVLAFASCVRLFGSKFAMDFEASPNSEPAAVASGDIIPVSLTTEPVQFPK